MPLNSRGLRRYKVYKDLRSPCTYVEVRIHIHVPRGGGLHVAQGLRGTAIKARRDRETFIVPGLHFIPSRIRDGKSDETPSTTMLDSLPTANNIKKTMDIYLCSKTMARDDAVERRCLYVQIITSREFCAFPITTCKIASRIFS